MAHVNAPSQKNQETKVTFHRHEERKKRKYLERCLYVEHATFTPLIIGTNGGMGDECEKFLKNLAELLAKEDGEDYSDVMMSLRPMLSFQGCCFVCDPGVKETMGTEHFQAILWPNIV